MNQQQRYRRSAGFWTSDRHAPEVGEAAIKDALQGLHEPVYLLEVDGKLAVSQKGTAFVGDTRNPPVGHHPLLAWAPPLPLTALGHPGFRRDHGLQYAYICGAMANGISSARMVEAAGNAGFLAFFGAAGLSLDQIEAAVDQLAERLGDTPYGFNLIHSPNDTALEQKTVDLYIAKQVRLVSASAFLDITTPLVQYRIHGIHRNERGDIVCPNRVIAKVSREEVARKFFSPPAQKHLQLLCEQGKITAEQAELARKIPVAQDLTAEADSGGHTDNRPALCLFPTLNAVKEQMMRDFGYDMDLRVGLAGGIATPDAAAAAFSMGAAYVLTGSVNQSCLEADTSSQVKKMLAEARQADVIMAPAADMFEMGVKVQVLKRGTMFAMRGFKLYDIYRTYDRFEDVPKTQRKLIEQTLLRCSFKTEWDNTRAFFAQRDPVQIERAEKDPKHKMALVFRSYLGRASLWAKNGIAERSIDYQIWCGPAMGAFNEWAKGSLLEFPENRTTVAVAMNLLFGAALTLRINQLVHQGVRLPSGTTTVAPLALNQLPPAIGT